MQQIIFDTDVVIHLLRQTDETVQQLQVLRRQESVFFVSPIVIAEVYAGAFKKEYEAIEIFFSLCQFAPIDAEIAKQAGIYAMQYKKAFHKISLEDYLLAATAKVSRYKLWTYNIKHFPMRDIELIR